MADNKRIDYINIQGNKQSTLYDTPEISRGIYYLTTRPDLYEPQRGNTFMFQVSFPADYFANDEILAAQNPYAAANGSEVLRVSVNSAAVPHFSSQPIEIKRGNATMKFAGTPSFKDGSIKLDDFIGAGSKDLVMAWQRKVYNVDTEKVGLASDYKLNANLIEYTPDFQVVRSWILYGCWISDIQEDDYSHDSTDKRTITCTLQYDLAKVDTTSI